MQDRNVTVLLTQPGATDSTSAVPDQVGSAADVEEGEKAEFDMILRLWREKQGRDDVQRFETAATKRLRMLHASKIFPYILLRVRLPGGVQVQARFNPNESLEVSQGFLLRGLK